MHIQCLCVYVLHIIFSDNKQATLECNVAKTYASDPHRGMECKYCISKV